MAQQTIEISTEEYTRLKDIETRFTILREHYQQADFCPTFEQIILGIERKPQEVNADLFPQK